MTSIRNGLAPIAAALLAACSAPTAPAVVTIPPAAPTPAPTPAPTAREDAPRAAVFEVLSVDDEADPFASVPDEALPAGVTLARETVSVGRGVTRTRAYARVAPRDRETLEAALDRARPWLARVRLPPGDRLVTGRVADLDAARGEGDVVAWRTYVVRGAAHLDERDVAEIEAKVDASMGLPAVTIAIGLTPAGAERFAAVTRDHLGRRLALVLDGHVESAPIVMSEITGGRVQVTMGAGGVDEQLAGARALARRIAGAATAPPTASPRP